jgi:hypothetical protein
MGWEERWGRCGGDKEGGTFADCTELLRAKKGNDLLKEPNIRKIVPFSTWCKKT